MCNSLLSCVICFWFCFWMCWLYAIHQEFIWLKLKLAFICFSLWTNYNFLIKSIHAFCFINNVDVHKALLVYGKGGNFVYKFFLNVGSLHLSANLPFQMSWKSIFCRDWATVWWRGWPRQGINLKPNVTEDSKSVRVSCGNKLVTNSCWKPTFNGTECIFAAFCYLYMNFIIYTSVFECFQFFQTRLNSILWSLKKIYKNGYTASFVEKYLKSCFNQLFLKRPHVLKIEKKTLTLVLPFLLLLLLQTRTKFPKAVKKNLECCKISIVFKSQINLWCFLFQKSITVSCVVDRL